MTQRFRKLSHSLYECKYHIVFCPKYRYRIFKETIGETVRQLVYQLCKQKEQIEVLELNVQPDHVHLVVSIPPKYSVSAIVGYLKGKSTMILFERYSILRKNFRGHNFWSRGYYVSTVGLDEQKVRQYIKNQIDNDAIEDRYDTDLVKDPFRGASSVLGK